MKRRTTRTIRKGGLVESTSVPTIFGIVLAGGRSRRFRGADKSLQILAGKTLVERVASRLRPQVDDLIISANGDPSRFSGMGVPVVADDISGYQGPFAGLAAGIAWLASDRPDVRWVVTVPVDVPFFPMDLVSRLAATAVPMDVPAVVVSGGRPHPVFGLWPVRIDGNLRLYLKDRRRGPLAEFLRAQGGTEVEFPAERQYDPFLNINTPSDLAKATAVVERFERKDSKPQI